jgi:Phage derived protein Gp49-like (DUF891)
MPVERIAAEGTWGTVEWAFDLRDRMPAKEFFLALDASDQRKIAALFQWLASDGRVPNREKFKGLGADSFGLWEFKSFQIRFLGDFRPGARFVVALGLTKKKDALKPADLKAADRILKENDQVERRAKK